MVVRVGSHGGLIIVEQFWDAHLYLLPFSLNAIRKVDCHTCGGPR